MRESFSLYATKSVARLALAAVLAVPLSFASASRQAEGPVRIGPAADAHGGVHLDAPGQFAHGSPNGSPDGPPNAAAGSAAAKPDGRRQFAQAKSQPVTQGWEATIRHAREDAVEFVGRPTTDGLPPGAQMLGAPPSGDLEAGRPAREPNSPRLEADVLWFGPAASGQARVLDGDTLDVGGERVRLEGIDAPERSQICKRADGSQWRCGIAAAQALERMVAGREVRCHSRGRGSYGRLLGHCFVGGTDINALLIERGFAWAFVKYSKRYAALERKARQSGAGIWQGEAQPAWEYRSNRWALAEGDAPGGCAIKGNISRRGRIYHMPWSPWYGRVKIETNKGERWFCSEKEAQAAGWRAVSH